MRDSVQLVFSFILMMMAFAFVLYFALDKTCRSDQKGQLQSPELRGYKVEICNGEKWVPYVVKP